MLHIIQTRKNNKKQFSNLLNNLRLLIHLKKLNLLPLFNELERKISDPISMDLRVKRRLTPSELFGLLIAFSFTGIFIWLINIKVGYPEDFRYYMIGESSPLFFYGYWILPIFKFLGLLPFNFAYFLWCSINIISILFAVRVFNGKPILVLASYQMLSIIYYGQISGLLAGGLALFWWGILHRKWNLAGLGWLLAITKFQVGISLGLILIWYASLKWKEIIRILITPLIICIISVMVYQFWPLELLQRLSDFSYIHLGITFWYYIGAWSLVFWIPAFILPLRKSYRLLALISLSSIAIPYFSQIDLITFFSLPVGWLPLFGYLGILFPIWGMKAVRLISIAPSICYLVIIIPSISRSITNRNKKTPINS